jgi:hypothetical protein
MSTQVSAAIERALGPVAAHFGLQAVDHVDHGNYTAILYRNGPVGLRVAVDWSEFRPFLTLFQFMADEPSGVEAPEETPDGRRRAFDVDDLIVLRESPSSPVGKMLGSREPQAAEELLREYAEVLRTSAGDVLSGDFRVFEKLAAIVRERRRKIAEGALPEQKKRRLPG